MTDYRAFRLSRINEPAYRHLWMLLFWPAYGLSFYALEWIIPQDSFHVMYHPLDDEIPFCELFVIPYVFWYLFMVFGVVYTLFADVPAFKRLMKFLFITFGGSTVFFALYPTCQNLRPEVFPRDNVLTQIMGFLYTIDTSTNVCPSLHVCGSIGAGLGIADTRRFSSRGWKAAIWIITALICVSTVFVKQHSVLDLFWGVVVSAAAWGIVYLLPKKI